jgi:hypothetical protein
MTTLTFDTHDFVKKLKIAGFSEEQAEVLTDLQKTTAFNTLEQARHDYELDEIASKRDLKELELVFKRDLKELELTISRDFKQVDVKIAETKAELIRWVVAVGLLQITIIAGLLLRLTGKV